MTNIELINAQADAFIERNDYEGLMSFLNELNISEVKDLIDDNVEIGYKAISLLPIKRAVNVFRLLDFPLQQRMFKKLPPERIKELLTELPPDDRTAFFSELDGDVVKSLIILLNPEDRKETLALLGYKEDSVGRLMTPDYIAVKRDWNIAMVLDHIRKYGKESETIDVVYVIDDEGHLIDDVQIKKILISTPETIMADILDNRIISLNANEPQESAIEIFRMNNRVALPVIDDSNILLGIVTVDDILWVQKEEYTEDIQMLGGTQALDEPYLDTPLLILFKKRVGSLSILMIGEMFTTTALAYFEGYLARAVVLSLFLPLVISCGGNSGSQAATLIVQAMALGEVKVRDWWRVMRREILSGLLLGATLGLIGATRIFVWHSFNPSLYGPHWASLAGTISFSLIFIVLWGSLAGSMLPLLLKKVGLDPATSSAPFVATMVDVTGIIIYFSVAIIFLSKTLLA